MHVVSCSSARYVRVFTALVVVCLAGGFFGTEAKVSVVGSAASADIAARQTGELWLQPSDLSAPAAQAMAQAVNDLQNGRPMHALPVFKSLTADPMFGGYALLYTGRAQGAMANWSEAAETAQQLLSREPGGYLGEAALWLSADAAENMGNPARAIEALRALTTLRPITPERAWLRLGRAAE